MRVGPLKKGNLPRRHGEQGEKTIANCKFGECKLQIAEAIQFHSLLSDLLRVLRASLVILIE